jgi:hypothetical protein
MIPKRKHPVVETTDQDDEDLLRRAYAAAFRAAKLKGYVFMQPSDRRSTVEELNGRRYVVLANGYETLAVYRVRNDGMLKGLKRWSKELDAA